MKEVGSPVNISASQKRELRNALLLSAMADYEWSSPRNDGRFKSRPPARRIENVQLNHSEPRAAGTRGSAAAQPVYAG